MTDEEMAEMYVVTLLDKNNSEFNKFLDKNLCDLELNKKQAGALLRIIKGVGFCSFLAGLKADRPEWHKVADGDLPNTEREVLIFMWGSYYLGHYKQYDGEDRSWHFEDFDEESEQVIAWCEIPTFKE